MNNNNLDYIKQHSILQRYLKVKIYLQNNKFLLKITIFTHILLETIINIS